MPKLRKPGFRNSRYKRFIKTRKPEERKKIAKQIKFVRKNPGNYERTFEDHLRILGIKREELYYQINNLLRSRKKVRILDVGCGAGLFLSELKRAHRDNIDATGLTLNPEKISERRVGKTGRFNVRVGLMEKFRPRKKYDLIFAVVSLAHSFHPLLAIENIYNSLRKGGKAYIDFTHYRPQRDSFVEYLKHKRIEADQRADCFMNIHFLMMDLGWLSHAHQISLKKF